MNNNDIKTVTLTINSEQAQRKLDDINRRLEQARLKRQDAFKRGDGKALQAYTKEIKSLETQATRLSSRAQTVEKVLRSLDSATPKELKATIKEINRELNSGNVERGPGNRSSSNQILRYLFSNRAREGVTFGHFKPPVCCAIVIKAISLQKEYIHTTHHAHHFLVNSCIHYMFLSLRFLDRYH